MSAHPGYAPRSSMVVEPCTRWSTDRSRRRRPFRGSSNSTARRWPTAVLDVATKSLAAAGPVEAVGITNQRASTLVWDRSTGQPDRTRARLAGPSHRVRLHHRQDRSRPGAGPQPIGDQGRLVVEQHRPARDRDLCFGTVDTWVAWMLSGGAVHVTDPSNAAVTGLLLADTTAWSTEACAALGVPMEMLPTVSTRPESSVRRVRLPGRPFGSARR